MKKLGIILSVVVMVVCLISTGAFAGGWLPGKITKIIQLPTEVQFEVERTSDSAIFLKAVNATKANELLAMALTLYSIGDPCEVHYNNSNQWDGIRITAP